MLELAKSRVVWLRRGWTLPLCNIQVLSTKVTLDFYVVYFALSHIVSQLVRLSSCYLKVKVYFATTCQMRTSMLIWSKRIGPDNFLIVALSINCNFVVFVISYHTSGQNCPTRKEIIFWPLKMWNYFDGQIITTHMSASQICISSCNC